MSTHHSYTKRELMICAANLYYDNPKRKKIQANINRVNAPHFLSLKFTPDEWPIYIRRF